MCPVWGLPAPVLIKGFGFHVADALVMELLIAEAVALVAGWPRGLIKRISTPEIRDSCLA